MKERLFQFFSKIEARLRACVNKRYALATVCGAMVTLLFSPFEYIIFLFPALSGLFLMLRMAESRRQSFMTGWWFGMGMYVSGLYWIANAMLVDAEQFGWMIPFVVIGMNGVLAIYSGLLGLVMWWLRGASMRFQWLGLAIAWGAIEYARSILFTGFPWNLLGYATVFSESMMQLAYDIPIIGLSVILVLLGTLPVLVASMPRKKAIILLTCAIIAVSGGYLYGQQQIMVANVIAQKPAKPSPYILQTTPIYAILQGNVEQKIKSNPQHRDHQLKQYLELMDQVREERFNATVAASAVEKKRPLIFVWPETAFPFLIMENSHWQDFLPTTLRENEVMVAGVMRGERDEADEASYYNSIMVVQRGRPIRFYDKRHLVPFGEYVPFRNSLPVEKLVPGMTDFSRGAGSHRLKQEIGDIMPSFTSMICYEAIFPHRISKEDIDGSRIIINVTNDGWFGGSIGPYQHLMMTRFRAIEYRKPLLRAANTGISASIDRYGRLDGSISLNMKGILYFDSKAYLKP